MELRERAVKTIHIITVAYNLPDATELLFNSAVERGVSKYDLHFHLFLHSGRPATVEMCEKLAGQYGPRVTYYPYGINRGLSRSWNEGLLEAQRQGADCMMIVNDDVFFSELDLDKIAKKAEDNPEAHMVSVAGWHTGFNKRWPSHGYSCFAVNPVAIEQIGMFDQNIFPIYLEDCDYAYRARLLGLTEVNVENTMVVHGGSMSVRSDPVLSRQNAGTHHKNGEYYKRKWGGLNEKETYDLPFNDENLTLFIHPDNRDQPYGPNYDRTDQEIVRV